MSQEAGSGSDDPDAMAAQLLSQFQGFVPVNMPVNNETGAEEVQESPQPETHQPKAQLIEIAVPIVENKSEYEYLPGHSTVLYVSRMDFHTSLYTVRLRSGERATVSHWPPNYPSYNSLICNPFWQITYGHLMQLKDGARALEDFENSDSSDDPIVTRKYYRSNKNLDGPASDLDYSEENDESETRPSRRRSAARGTFRKFFPDSSDSEGEPEVDSAESSDELSQPRTRQRRKLRERKNNGSSAGQRRSSRAIRRRNMRERHEDELSDVEVTVPRKTKYSGAREVFHQIPQDDAFRERHFGCCDTCGIYEDDEEKGPLVFCQGCTSSIHQVCLGPRGSREHLVTKVDEDLFILQCRRCLGTSYKKHDIRPHLGHCSGCRQAGPMSEPLRERLTSREEQQQRIDNGGTDPITDIDKSRVNNVDNVLFRCTGCHRAFHLEHLPPVDTSDASKNFEHYSTHWQCHDCADLPGEVDLILAWRIAQSATGEHPTDVTLQLVPEIEREYLVKWKAKSYFQVTWMPGDWTWGHNNHAMMTSFEKSPRSARPINTIAEAVPEQNLRIDIIFEVQWSPNATTDADKRNPAMVEETFAKYKGLNYEDSVWEVAPQPSDPVKWQDFITAFEEWLRRDTVRLPNRQTLKRHLETFRALDFDVQLRLRDQPELLTGGRLMQYQLEGVNWLYYMLYCKRNAILADEMGLGKTIQVIGLFATLIEKHSCWPFLVVVPNSTVPNWRREINKFAPEIQVATYFGTEFQRQMVKDQEMFPSGSNNLHCHVVIASYETMINDEARSVLAKVPWAGLVVDEGHRLKNDETKLYENLSRMKFDYKVLLTGTPLQNNIRELFNIIQFLDPKLNAEQLEEQYKVLNSENIRSLHEMIRPSFFRRTKTEVLPFLPPVVQIIVPVGMSVVQKKLYKSILRKSPDLIKAICQKQSNMLKRHEKYNLNNILMQLRKCLCHPFVYNSQIEEATNDAKLAHQRLVGASGKFQLLSLMLPKLREKGHRVLMFSQFLQNIDLVEDFLTGLDLPYCRLDGKLNAREKQAQIDKFNEPDSSVFAFLLSTRSGGVGINLATADTVIIMDPDFNPKQDMQALSRAHRIGQTKPVLVFHLTTRGSVEEKIMEKGKKKVALEHVLIERLQDEEEDEDLESILRHGAQALFDEDDDNEDDHYTSEMVDALLVRSHSEPNDQGCDPSSAAQPQFNFARVWQKDRNALEEVTVSEDVPADVAVWDKILQDRERHAQTLPSTSDENLGRGKRKRPTISYGAREEEGADLDGVSSSVENSPAKKQARKTPSESDDDFNGDEKAEDSDSDDEEEDAPKVRYRPFHRAQVPRNPYSTGLDGATDFPSLPTCIACTERHPHGECPLKAAGVENCPLCGIAHFGGRRICPHLHSQVQIQRMLDALSQSTESWGLVSAAKKYLKGVVANMNTEARRASKPLAQTSNTNSLSSPISSASPAVTQAPADSHQPPANLSQQTATQPAQNPPPVPPSQFMPLDQNASTRALVGVAQPPGYGLTLSQAAGLPQLGTFNRQPSAASVERTASPRTFSGGVIDLTGPDSPDPPALPSHPQSQQHRPGF